MGRTSLRALEQLDYRDPVPFLVQLRQFERKLALSETPEKVRAMRTNRLKEWRETREAAIFCYLMGQRTQRTIYLARGENQDYDFVASWLDQDTLNYAPVQLKELVPATLNPSLSIEGVISGLSKYVDSKNLTVAIHLNQRGRFMLSELQIPDLAIAGLWMFGAVAPDQSSWGLWGDFLTSPSESVHEYPGV
jgi:hypothetical protein